MNEVITEWLATIFLLFYVIFSIYLISIITYPALPAAQQPDQQRVGG